MNVYNIAIIILSFVFILYESGALIYDYRRLKHGEHAIEDIIRDMLFIVTAMVFVNIAVG